MPVWGASQIVTAVPEVRQLGLQSGDEFLLLACDGIWDVLTNQEVRRRVVSARTCMAQASVQLETVCTAPPASQLATQRGWQQTRMDVLLFLAPEPGNSGRRQSWVTGHAWTLCDTYIAGCDRSANPR